MADQHIEQTYACFDTPFGKTVLSKLEQRGPKIMRLPAVETVRIEKLPGSLEFPKLPDRFDWLIFSDVLTVDYFTELAGEAGFDLFELDGLRICALGEAVADRLRFAQVHADLIPSRNDPEIVCRQLAEFAAEDFSSIRCLLINSAQSESALSSELTRKVAEIIELPIYRAVLPKDSELVKLKTLFKGGAIDQMIFTSPVDLIYFTHLFPNENLSILLADSQITAADAVTYQNLLENGFKPSFFR